MKCPRCGAWNQAYLPKCVKCGAPLEDNHNEIKSWEEDMHKKKPSLQIAQFEDGEDDIDLSPVSPDRFDPEDYDHAGLSDEIEELKLRRKEGAERLAQMKQQAERVRRSLDEAEIILPVPEPDDMPSAYAADPAVIRRRQQIRQDIYHQGAQKADEYSESELSYNRSNNRYSGEENNERPLAYTDDDHDAPYYYDGYIPETGDLEAMTNEEYMPRRIQTRASHDDSYASFDSTARRSHRLRTTLIKIAVSLFCFVLV